ncbi:vWA domain-containing protein [Legionella quinlivanii]|uniref:vWA domain-containing protein n=1 Tax=Legionella quinlivanii TaxID=45073 RepID=UPI0022438027|nr:VWA domain-containing protein [Legionella quinlivanii]MCW8452381.1 VWA domain-containing protein [Legionella quinlivanii]
MVIDFHFLRPLWLLAFLPLCWLFWRLWKQKAPLQAWAAICDPHLLSQLIKNQHSGKRQHSLLLLLTSFGLIIIALAGPVWKKLPVPAFKLLQPRIIVLDLSDAMLEEDLKPNRLLRARFILHDLFNRKDTGQTGLIVYTGESFVVSPLTEDAKTIDSLLDSLNPQIMPVNGQDLSIALQQAAQLIEQAGFSGGQILVLTATPPDASALKAASRLANQGIETSIMPVLADSAVYPIFKPLANAGKGMLLDLNNENASLNRWLSRAITSKQYTLSEQNEIPVWQDEGRWFLIPALLFLMPVFRRGWLQRVQL